MSSVMLNATCSFFDVKNIEESKLPSKTGAVRFLAVSALVASVFASALIPAVICTGVIAATTAAIMLKNRKVEQLNKSEVANTFVEQLNESEVVNDFKNKIDSYPKEKKCGLLTVCLSYLTKKIEEMPKEISTSRKFWPFKTSSMPIEDYLVKDIQKYAKESGDELVKERREGKITIEPTEDQKKVERLSIVPTLNIIEHLYTQLGKHNKAKEITDFVKQIQLNSENPVNQATE